jgi:hypothetical protein
VKPSRVEPASFDAGKSARTTRALSSAAALAPTCAFCAAAAAAAALFARSVAEKDARGLIPVTLPSLSAS